MENNYIAKLRKRNNLTQQELANKLFVSNKTISKWENNRGLPDISLIIPLSKVLNVTPLEILKGEDIKNKVNNQVDINAIIKYNKERKIYKKQETIKAFKILLIILVIFWMTLFCYNYIRVTKYNQEPLFLIITKEEYIKEDAANYFIKKEKGLGYTWILKGSLSNDNGDSIIMNKDSNYHFVIDQELLYIFNINVYSKIIGISEYNTFNFVYLSKPILSIVITILYIIFSYYLIIKLYNSKIHKLIIIYILSILTTLLLFYINGFYIFDQIPSKLIMLRLIVYPIILSIIIYYLITFIIKTKRTKK